MEAMGELAAGGALRWAKLPAAAAPVQPPAPPPPAASIRALRSVPAGHQYPDALASDGGGPGDLARCLELLKTLSSTAVDGAALLTFREAADFADNVEEISRAAEYLQIVAAGAVDRTRREATTAVRSAAVGLGSGAAVGWVTGWGAENVVHGPGGWVTGSAVQAVGGPAHSGSAAHAQPDGDQPDGGLGTGQAADGRPVSAAPDPAGDGYRNAAEFLRTRLRIGAPEARRRIALAASLLPRTGFTGHTEPAERPELGAAVAAGTVASRPATIITMALDRVRHHATEDQTARMEHALTRTAAEYDTDFLTRIARRWTDAIDQDGAEPTENELRRRQGAFLRPARRGLHHVEIFATADQYEHLLTVMNTATNPRTRAGAAQGNDDVNHGNGDSNGAAADTGVMTGAGTGTDSGAAADTGVMTGAGTGTDSGAAAVNSALAGENGNGQDNAGTHDADPDPGLDLRTRPQRLLDGLVGACKAALTSEALPAAGGLRPQIMVTIDYKDLLDRLEHSTIQGPRYRSRSAATGDSHGCGNTRGDKSTGDPAYGEEPHDSGDHDGHSYEGHSYDGHSYDGHRSGAADPTGSTAGSPGMPGTGSFTFTGPVTAATVRKIACDADIIPVLLGSEGRILDIGRTTRIFPPHIRKAITTRDQGCAFPGCTIPAPWCEAHHITYWSHGGTTSTDNGTLLCSHHHHLIHKEQWTIQTRDGIPWFIPPPHIDPRQRPQRNTYFTTNTG